MTYTFLTQRHPEDEVTRYFAISEDRIETLRASKTYDRFGQKVGTYNAGDSITFTSQAAVDLANKVAKEQDSDYNFDIDDVVSGYDNSDVFDEIESAIEKSDLKDREDFELNYETVRGFDYHDGHNFRTVVVDSEYHETEWEEVYNEDLSDELNKVIDDMEFIKERAGAKVYRGGNYQITESFWQGHWENYELVSLDEIPEY